MDVELYVYDLSGGMARQFSAALIGQQIDAIYHTSVVLNRVEYFFGQGIHRKIPGTTHHGDPMKVVRLGKTQLTTDVIEDYIQSLEAIYTPESYDLFVHNCNNFSQDLSMFLVGKSIPHEIRSLPETFLRTPMGQMLRSQIDQSMRTMTQAPDAVSGRDAPRAQTNGVKPLQHTNGADLRPALINGAAPKSQPGQVYNITSTTAFNSLLSRASKSSAIVFFTSATCPPCKMLYPLYDELAESATEDKCIFVKVDVSQAHDIGSQYSIQATPTFITFLKGKKLDEWKGADSAALRGNVRLLIQMSTTSHRHATLNCPTFHAPVTSPTIFTKTPPLDKLVAKLGPHGTDIAVQQLTSYIRTRENEGVANAALPDLASLTPAIAKLYPSVPSDLQFALVDLVRIAAVDARVSSYLTTNPSLLTNLFRNTSWSVAPASLRLVTCQLACNLWSSSIFQESLSQTPHKIRDSIEELVAGCTVSSPQNNNTSQRAQQAAAALVYNLAALNHNERIRGRSDVFAVSEDVEAAVVSAVYEEPGDKETLRSLGMALGMLLYAGEEGNGVEGLCEAMELAECLKEKEKLELLKDLGILKELREMLARK